MKKRTKSNNKCSEVLIQELLYSQNPTIILYIPFVKRTTLVKVPHAWISD